MLRKNILGQSEIAVSAVGLGTVKFGRNTQVKYPTSFQLPSDQEIRNLLSLACDLQINFIDTAPAYGISEERLGKLLTDRHSWVLATKVGEEFIDDASRFDFSANAAQKSIERSLRRLKTDYLDIVLIHSDGNDLDILTSSTLLSQLNRMKQQGLIRAIGISSKTVAGGKLGVDLLDVVMVTHNLSYGDEKSVIAYAAEKNKGVLIKKGLASGHFANNPHEDPVQAAMNFIFKENIDSIILGTLNPQHLQHNVQCAMRAMGDL